MDKKTIKNPVNKFLRKIQKVIRVDNIVVFGSQSANTAKKDSDIDLIVISKDFAKWNEDKRLNLLYKASRFIIPEIHPWGVTPEELEKASQLTTIGHARITGTYLNKK